MVVSTPPYKISHPHNYDYTLHRNDGYHAHITTLWFDQNGANNLAIY